MKGVVLAGGLGTRLSPLTKVTNKHLLPVYNKPMIYYPIESLRVAGITNILMVTGGNSAGDFLKLLGNGTDFDVSLYYTYQVGEGGIADALSLAESFVGDDKVVVVLGDNIIERNFIEAARRFEQQDEGAKILLKAIEDPERFGVAELDGDRVCNIEEKPTQPRSNLAVTGIYMFDRHVFNIIKTLKPSGRGELEITDVNNNYIENNQLTYETLDGWWSDAGTFSSLAKVSDLVRKTGANNVDV